MGGGISAGQLLAGIVGPAYGWRLPFLIVSIPTFMLAVLVLFSAKEPIRGSQEEEFVQYNKHILTLSAQQATTIQSPKGGTVQNDINAQDKVQDGSALIIEDFEVQTRVKATIENEESYNERIDCSKVAILLSTKTVVLIYLQGFPGCVPWGMVYVYLNDYLSANRGLSVQSATIALTMFGVGGFFGQCFGGYVGQALYNRNKRYASYFIALATVLGIFPLLYVVNGTAGGLVFFVSAILAGFLVSITGPNVRSMLQNVCTPETRGTAFAFFNLSDDIGKGGGPVIVAALASSLGSRQTAFNVCICFWIFCGVTLWLTAYTVEEDESKVQLQIRQSLGNEPVSARDDFTSPFPNIDIQDLQSTITENSGDEAGWKEFRRNMVFTSQRHENSKSFDENVSSMHSERRYLYEEVVEAKSSHSWTDFESSDIIAHDHLGWHTLKKKRREEHIADVASDREMQL